MTSRPKNNIDIRQYHLWWVLWQARDFLSFILFLVDLEQIDLALQKPGHTISVDYNWKYDSVAMLLNTLEVTHIESLYVIFKKIFFLVQPCSFYGVVVDLQTDLQEVGALHNWRGPWNLSRVDTPLQSCNDIDTTLCMQSHMAKIGTTYPYMIGYQNSWLKVSGNLPAL